MLKPRLNSMHLKINVNLLLLIKGIIIFNISLDMTQVQNSKHCKNDNLLLGNA